MERGSRFFATTTRTIAILSASLLLSGAWPADAHAQEDHHHSLPSAQLELKLSNGERWPADEHTVNAVRKMTALLDEATKTQPTSAGEYRTLGRTLQKELGLLIQGCTMTGASHDQLHIWLAGLTPAIASLAEVSDRDHGEHMVHEVRTQLSKFDQFFQLS